MCALLPFLKKILPFFKMTYTASIYLTVFFTLERFYGICVSKKTPSLKRIKLGIVLVCVFAILFNIPDLFLGK